MPTESAFLLAGLLFIAAALGYVFAKFGDPEADEDLNDNLSSDYLKGLNFVLNEEPDRAVEVFTRMADLDDDALETHFALGSLFRKRGEVDRAIRVHQNLMARPNLGREHVNQAHAALAEDYLSAGLFDRAENLFQKLLDSQEFSLLALRRLLRIYEVTRDWGQAVEIHARLSKADPEEAKSNRVAHYYCEFAEQARADKDYAAARDCLKKAESSKYGTVRSKLIQADIAHDLSKEKDAIRLYQQVAKSAPHLLVVLIPRLAASYRADDDEPGFSRCLNDLVAADADTLGSIAMAAVLDSSINDPLALRALQRFLAEDRLLSGLIDIERIESLSESERVRSLSNVRGALRAIVTTRPSYRCAECGYASITLQWQCPGCRAWETMAPETQINLLPNY